MMKNIFLNKFPLLLQQKVSHFKSDIFKARELAQQVRSWLPGSTWWKERPDFQVVFSPP